MADGFIGLFQGRRGSGKTLTLVQLGLDYYTLGWKIFSNFKCSYAKKISNDFIINLDTHSDLRDCVILVDEIQVLFDSRLWKSASSISFSHFLMQIRKRNIVILGSTQYVDTVEKRFRQHVDVLICPEFDEDYLVCYVTFYDLTSFEDSSVPDFFSYAYYAKPLFPLYDTSEMIA